MRLLLKSLGTALAFPLFLLLLPFIAIGIGIICVNATVSGMFRRARWLRDLRRDGRALPAAVFLAQTHRGTLIIDRPGINFRKTRVWWTDENVIDITPVPIPTDEERLQLCVRTNGLTPHEFDLWCWRRYLSPDTGGATLITPLRHGERLANMLKSRLPHLACVTSWSAVAALHAQDAEPQPDGNSDPSAGTFDKE